MSSKVSDGAAPFPFVSRAARANVIEKIVAGFGVAWNAFGVMQFVNTVRSTPESLTKMGMTSMQASVVASYPAWMNVAFAVGTFGGLLGSLLLFLRPRAAKRVFAASLIGYVILYVGDVTEGVFAALGMSQVTILTLVVAIAAALFFWSKNLERRAAHS
jgi:hypothetical protein